MRQTSHISGIAVAAAAVTVAVRLGPSFSMLHFPAIVFFRGPSFSSRANSAPLTVDQGSVLVP